MQNELKYWYLRNHKLFRVLNNQDIKQLCIITGFRHAKKGEIVYLSSSDEARIYLLKKGSLKIVKIDDDGNELIRDIILKGDLFGQLEFDGNAENGEYAVALTNDVTICSFLDEDFEKVLFKHPDLAVSYIKIVGFHLKRIRNNYSNLMFRNARERLNMFIKDWYQKEGNEINRVIVLKNYLTQSDIAQIICTSRQTATQLLNDMEHEGILKYDRKQIQIFKPELL